LNPERAVFLPNMETALNFVHDGRPLAGEFSAVFGLGIVGLLTAGLMASFPTAATLGFDRYALRREAGLAVGLDAALDPLDPQAWIEIERELRSAGMPDGLDLCYEVSGNPGALRLAIERCGFAGRVVIGSWYGTKVVELPLGGDFHRSRIRLISSQVSTIAPELSGRWSKVRRLGEVFRRLDRLQPERWITHRYVIGEAAKAYRQLDEDPAAILQLVFEY
jgi:threonine dehydrogenase-like Zn-dependent dehydrogenase